MTQPDQLPDAIEATDDGLAAVAPLMPPVVDDNPADGGGTEIDGRELAPNDLDIPEQE